MSILVASMAERHPLRRSLPERSGHFADAGLTIMRSSPADGPEIWCRCDGGPHGFLSIAAHAHADALAIEVRHEGVEILVDPGTYCYSSEPSLAQLLQVDPRPQHPRARPPGPVRFGGPYPLDPIGYHPAARDEA